MPTIPNWGYSYATPLDAAYADIWGPLYNTLHLNWGSQLLTRTANYNFADYTLERPLLSDAAYKVYDAGNQNGSFTLDYTNAIHQQITLTGNATLSSISNWPATGRAGVLHLKILQDGTGGHTFSWGSAFKFPDATSPTVTATASARDRFTLVTEDAGTTIDVLTSGQAFG